MASNISGTSEKRAEIGMEAVKSELYAAVLGQKWDRVLEIYKKHPHPEIHAAKITKLGDTALHVAITHGSDTIVLKLFDEIEKTETAKETLSVKNSRKDTPLHCAASRGSLTICQRIIRLEESLVNRRNEENETPLFLAALNGHKQTFLYLHLVCSKMDTDSRLWSRKNGDTILHCTIQREYFDLSFLIIHLYEGIAGYVNEEGYTPLKALASNPSAFKSGTRLTWWDRLRYHYIRVEKLKFDSKTFHAIDIENSDIHHQFSKVDAYAESHKTRGSIRKIKEKHEWSAQIMEELVKRTSEYEFNENESPPFEEESNEELLLQRIKNTDDEKNKPFDPEHLMKFMSGDEQNQQDSPGLKWLRQAQALLLSSYGHLAGEKASKKDKKSTALLIATKFGLRELVKKILNDLPVAIHDKTPNKERNIVLQAIQKRQPHVLKLLMKHQLWPRLREAVDVDGNNALHLAAMLPEHMPWEIQGSAMQMQWEVKWFEYVRKNMPPYLISQDNKEGDTPEKIFAKLHKNLVKESNDWLKDTSGSYSIVAALTAGVTYATSYTVPGGTDETTGRPILKGLFAFNVFAISVLVSFCFSVTSLAAFLAVYSARMQPKDFRKSLPLKLVLGLTSFFISVISMLVSFCAAHSFELDHGNKHKIINPWYSLILLPLSFYTAAQIPLYWDLLRATFTELPQPKYVGEDVTV